MPIPTYTLGYPPDGSSLGQTKVVIRNNLDGTFQTLGVDHVNNNGTNGSLTGNAGTHAQAQFLNRPTVPGGLSNGYETVYSKSTTGQGELYFTRGSTGVEFQLTAGPNSTTNFGAANGWTFLPGGIILQWGIKNSTGGSGQVVTLPTAFPNNFFSAQATMIRNSSNVDAIYSTTNPTVGVVTQIVFRDTSSGNPFYWLAIGN